MMRQEGDWPCADIRISERVNATLGRVSPAVPRTMKRIIRGALDLFRKPELRYVELHLTDHCNLNCKGCTHYCPVAPPRFADLRQHVSDMRRLRRLFRNIRTIRLMGGEPLLHPDPASFIVATRDVFPKARIRFVTNGILLPQAPRDFWDACRNTKTIVDVSVYPPVADRMADLRSLCEARGVILHTRVVKTFHAHGNFKGDSDEQTAFALCRRRYFWPVLQDGRLYVCGMPAFVHYFNERFGYRIPSDPGIDIHSPAARGRALLRQLDQPVETCKWCSYDFMPFPWSASSRLPEEWDAAEQLKCPCPEITNEPCS